MQLPCSSSMNRDLAMLKLLMILVHVLLVLFCVQIAENHLLSLNESSVTVTVVNFL